MFERTLVLLLERMKVSNTVLSTENLKWLGENLAKDHKNHPDFPEAIHLIDSLLKCKGENAKIVI